MKLKSLWNENSFCLNLSEEHIPSLKEFDCVELKYSLDYRDNNFRRKLFERFSTVIRPHHTVFLVPPKYNYQIPIILMTIAGMSSSIPYIIRFDRGKDPDLQEPLVEDLENIRWLARKSTQTSKEYYNQFS